MTGQSQYPYDVFVSYNQADEDWVLDWLLPQLTNAGLQVATRYDTRILGAPKIENVERAVNSSRRTIVVLTPEWLDDEWNEFEALLVMGADLAARKRKLIPLLLKPCTPPEPISFREPADFTDEHKWNREAGKLARDLVNVLPAPVPWREQEGVRNWRGWKRWLRRYRWRVLVGTVALLALWVVIFTLLKIPPFHQRQVWVRENLNAEGAITLHNTGSTLLAGSRNPNPGCTPPKGLWYREENSNAWQESDVDDDLLCIENFDRGASWSAILSFASLDDRVYALTSHSGILVSSDNGARFDRRFPNFSYIIRSDYSLNPHSLRVISRNGGPPLLWVAGQENGLLVYRNDRWLANHEGCNGLPPTLIAISVWVNQEIVVIGSDSQGLWASFDGGQNCRLVFDSTGRYIFHGLWDVSAGHHRFLALVQDTQMERRNDELGNWQLLDFCPRGNSCTDAGWWADQTTPLWHGTRPAQDVFVQQRATGDYEWYLVTESGQVWRGTVGLNRPEDLADIRRCYIPPACFTRFAPVAPGQPPYLLAADYVYQYQQGPWWKLLWP